MTTVLIVEDDPSVITLLDTVLRTSGYEVAVARDGLAGLLQLGSLDADAVVLDLAMPDVGGVRLLAQLAEEHDGRLPVPVLVVTGTADAAARVAPWVDADDVFTKPFDPDALLARLRVHLPAGGDRP